MPIIERGPLIDRTAVTSLKAEYQAGRSLALLRVEIIEFRIERRSDDELDRELASRKAIREQGDMFQLSKSIAPEASPFSFKYSYRDDDGIHTGTCQDWETEATFLRRRSEFQSEARALEWMQHKFGTELPEKGIVFAMGTHKRRQEQWLINGIVQIRPQALQHTLL